MFTAATVLDVDLAGDTRRPGLALRRERRLLVAAPRSPAPGRQSDGSGRSRGVTDWTAIEGAVPVSDGPVELTVAGHATWPISLLANGQ